MGNKLFGTDGVRGVANVYPLTADFAMKLGMAAGQKICTDKRKVAIGKDTRLSGDMLEAALTAGFTSMGIDVIHLGVLPTPAMTMITPEMGVDMAVMITASHNPFQDNGIKLLAASGDKFSDAITAELEALIEKSDFTFSPDAIGKVSCDYSVIEKYKKIVLSVAKGQKLDGLKVVLDCANGCFSEIMPEVFRALGADVIVTANEPDGLNINRDCGSQHPQKMMEIVKANGADLGVAADGDGDRIVIVDEKGNKIVAEQLIAFLAQYLQNEGILKGRPVVSTILSNTALERFIKSLGLNYYDTPVGERHVIVKMKEVDGAVGGEESGHLVTTDYSRSGDCLVVSLIICLGVLKLGKKVSEIFPLFQFDPFVFVNPRFDKQEKIKIIMNDAEVINIIEQAKKDIEGHGRVVVRASGTEPLIRIWVSGENETMVNEISGRIIKKIESFK